MCPRDSAREDPVGCLEGAASRSGGVGWRRTEERIIGAVIEHEGGLEGLSRLRAFVETRCREEGVVEEDRTALELVTEEICVNIIEHGYETGRGPITIEMVAEEDPVRLTFRDRGRAFDPREAPAPDLDSGWEERRVGGLGWHLVREMVDELEYRRDDDGVNVLEVRKFVRRVGSLRPAEDRSRRGRSG